MRKIVYKNYKKNFRDKFYVKVNQFTCKEGVTNFFFLKVKTFLFIISEYAAFSVVWRWNLLATCSLRDRLFMFKLSTILQLGN